MLRREERLSRKTDPGRPTRRAAFTYGTIAYLSGTTPRVAVVVSKKIFKTAVKRNLLKRRFKVVLQEMIRSGGLTKSAIVYLNARAGVARLSDIRMSLASVLK